MSRSTTSIRRIVALGLVTTVILIAAWLIVDDTDRDVGAAPAVVIDTSGERPVFTQPMMPHAMPELLPEPPSNAVDVIAFDTSTTSADPDAGSAADGEVALRVVDEQGRPVVDTAICAVTFGTGDVLQQLGFTDDAGLATVPLPRAGLALEARQPNLGTSGFIAPADLRRQRNTVVTLTLRPDVSINGRVVHADGAPAAGASVQCRPQHEQSRPRGRVPALTTTDANGTFALLVSPWIALEISAELDGIATVPMRVRSSRELVLELPGRWSVGGLVVDGDDEPVAGARVTVWRSVPGVDIERDGTERLTPHRIDVLTNRDGSFAVNVPTLSEYTVMARVDDDPPSPDVRTIVDDWTPHATVRLRIPDASEIAGRVVDEYGSPVPDALVFARPAHLFQPELDPYGPTAFTRFGQAQDNSDRDGRFVLGPLNGAATYIVFCRPDPRRPDRKVVVRDVLGSTSDLVLVASDDNLRRASWTGEIYDETSGLVIAAPVITLIIRLDDIVLPAGLSPQVADGSFVIDSLAPGYDYRLRVDAPGRSAFQSDWWTATIPGRRDIIRLAPAGQLEVDAGEPGVDVIVRRVDDAFGVDGTVADATGLAGRVTFSQLVAGTYEVTTVREETLKTSRITVVAGRLARLAVER